MHCTHTFPSTITPITQLSPFTHQLWLPHHTCTSFSHSHKSSTQTLTQCEVLFCPGYISERSSPYLLSLCVTPDCPTFDLWTCACDLDSCLVLFTTLLCLWYSCFCLLTIACLILPPLNKYWCNWIRTPQTSSLQKTSPHKDPAPFRSTSLGMDTRVLFALKQGPRSLEHHIREFSACAQDSDLPDIILIDIFCDGINQPLQTQLRREGPRSSLSCFFWVCVDYWLTIHCGCSGGGSQHCTLSQNGRRSWVSEQSCQAWICSHQACQAGVPGQDGYHARGCTSLVRIDG